MRFVVTVTLGPDEVGRQIVRENDITNAVQGLLYQAMNLQRDAATNALASPFDAVQVTVIEHATKSST